MLKIDTMKKCTALLFSTLLAWSVHAQNHPTYDSLVQEAWQLYENKSFLASGQTYAQAFASRGNLGEVNDRYNAACSWALAGVEDSAFVQLFRIAERGNYANYDHLTTDVDLKSLYADDRWYEVVALVEKNKERVEANYDKPLVAMLDTIYREDQKYRLQMDSVQKKYGFESKEMRALIQTMNEKDSANLVAIETVLEDRGWLGADVIGPQGNMTLFLVIQHADQETQEKYLPMMREAAKEGKARPADLALLEDRVALGQGKKQIYGSQIGVDSTGQHFVRPLEDPLTVDERRAAVGLPPLAEYASYFGITWDAEAYAQQLPDIEKKEKNL